MKKNKLRMLIDGIEKLKILMLPKRKSKKGAISIFGKWHLGSFWLKER